MGNQKNDDVSTEMDKLVKTISEKKKVSLNDLRKTCNKIEKNTLDRWLITLEDANLIEIEYGLNGTTVHWIGQEIEEPEEDIKIEQFQESPIEEPEESLAAQYRRPHVVESALPSKIRKVEEPEDKTETNIASDIRKASITDLKEKAKLEELLKERETLYKEKFAAIEGKLEADVAGLTEVILDKQNRLSQLKENLLSVPKKIAETQGVAKQMNDLTQESKTALKNAKDQIQNLNSTLLNSKDSLGSKISELGMILEKEVDKISELERLGVGVDSKISKLKSASDSLKSQMAEINNSLTQVMTEVEEATEMKVDIDSLKDALKEAAAEHTNTLNQLHGELEKLGNVEEGLGKYVSDYEKKIDQVEQYVMESESELNELKAAAEAEYIKKCLSKLQETSLAYADQLEDAITHDEIIAQKIDKAKSRISGIVKDGEELADELEREPALENNYSKVKNSMKKKSEVMKARINESGMAETEIMMEKEVKKRKSSSRKKKKYDD